MPDLKGKPSVLLVANNLSHNCTSNKYLIFKFKPKSPHYCIKSLCHLTVHAFRIFPSLSVSNYNTFSVQCLVEKPLMFIQPYDCIGLESEKCSRAAEWVPHASRDRPPILKQGPQSACNIGLETALQENTETKVLMDFCMKMNTILCMQLW